MVLLMIHGLETARDVRQQTDVCGRTLTDAAYEDGEVWREVGECDRMYCAVLRCNGVFVVDCVRIFCRPL